MHFLNILLNTKRNRNLWGLLENGQVLFGKTFRFHLPRADILLSGQARNSFYKYDTIYSRSIRFMSQYQFGSHYTPLEPQSHSGIPFSANAVPIFTASFHKKCYLNLYEQENRVQQSILEPVAFPSYIRRMEIEILKKFVLKRHSKAVAMSRRKEPRLFQGTLEVGSYE